ncbi:Gfo/Idh/MocA family protein [Planctomycetes bacterium K23_9]|uniref:Putative oxidoreductase YdgJ n=1 Tax=Stieleria marina TaxID=1930275 RepID=A0A517NYB7_9BACT|nr:putative oxidoreductase YdgJ [Planctomycetes bacterium K23_9]
MSDDYGLSSVKETVAIAPPSIDYLPKMPTTYRPKIGLIGAGGVSEFHLKAYRECGFDVAVIADRNIEKAQARRDEFFPQADAVNDYRELIGRDEIEVVDVTPHPVDRVPIVKAAIAAGKHVLSQKPFVLDLDVGDELIAQAARQNVRLAVNQNGRWAPHFSYMQQAVASGLIGEVTSIDFSLQWDQTWITGNEAFEKIHHLVLFDFGIHWFDIAGCLMGDQKAESVFATATRFEQQTFEPPAIASAIIQYPSAQVRMSFNAHTRLGEEDVTTIVGTKGTLRCRGRGLNEQSEMQVFLENGCYVAPLSGCWTENGFQGTMAELLCAIQDNRTPWNSAANNTKGLELCFAALESANTNQVVPVGAVRGLLSF